MGDHLSSGPGMGRYLLAGIMTYTEVPPQYNQVTMGSIAAHHNMGDAKRAYLNMPLDVDSEIMPRLNLCISDDRRQRLCSSSRGSVRAHESDQPTRLPVLLLCSAR